MKILQWFRIVDSHDGRLSLSSLAFVATLVLLFAHESAVTLGAFAVASLVYAHRRILVHRGAARQQRMDELMVSLDSLGAVLKESDRRLERVEGRLAIETNRGRG